ncbi:DMT family transporter [Roseimarinus sediminis]|jgi:drug/metabolite transporter (DMT)-like permease|uniref:DMT family transporter n=1 Tax=Roseimarinus sediminis TaxID=1610899 RepID=UPI003D191098
MGKLKLLSDRSKGYLFSLLATVAFANVYIFSKAALNEVSMPQFWVYWFAVAFSANLLFNWREGTLPLIRKMKQSDLRTFAFLGALEIITSLTFFFSIRMIPDPAITSFMGNMYVVFLIVLGVLMLREKFTAIESIGASITVIGAFAVGYKGGTSLSDFFIPGTGIVLINTFMAAFSSIYAKKAIHRFPPALVNLNRSFWLFLFAIIFMHQAGDPLAIPASALKNIVIGALLGPVTAILSIYYSFKYIEASRSSVIQGLKGVFVLLGSLLYFGMFPPPIQVAGGIVSVLGVLIMTLAKARLLKLKRKNKQE